MTQTDPIEARRRALAALPEPDLHALLQTVPEIERALAGEGPLAPASPGWRGDAMPLPATLHAIAHVLSGRVGMSMLLEGLDRPAMHLLALADFHDGTLSAAQVCAELGSDDIDVLEPAAERLRQLTFATRTGAWLELLPDARGRVTLPHPPLDLVAEHWTVATVRACLVALGVNKPPTRKQDLLDAMRDLLRDHEAMTGIIDELDEDAHDLLEALVEGGPTALPELGIDYYYPSYSYAYGGRSPADPGLQALVDRGLVHVWIDEQVVATFQDLVVGVRGALFQSWPTTAPSVTAGPLTQDPAFLPATVALLGRVADLWAAQPAKALKTGGIGVTPVRAAAKALDAPDGHVGLVVHLAVQLGLLGRVETGPPTGRGRNRTQPMGWAPTALMRTWRERRPEEQWARLVGHWARDLHLDESDGLPTRWDMSLSTIPTHEARRALLRLLHDQPSGMGLARAELGSLITYRAPYHAWGVLLDGILAGARALGLVSAEGPIGLTTLGRQALTDPDDVRPATASGDGTEQLIVQGDQTIMVPPGVDAAVVARLQRIAELETDSTVRTYRLSESAIARSIDAGDTVEEIVAFLTASSATGVPQHVEYHILDIGRRHGQLAAGDAMSYLRSDDPALLARAVRLKRAKLQLLAPTVAVSALPRPKLLSVLRAADLMPVAEGVGSGTDPDDPDQQVGQTPMGLPTRLPALRPTMVRAADPSTVATLRAAPTGTGRLTHTGAWLDDTDRTQHEQLFR